MDPIEPVVKKEEDDEPEIKAEGEPSAAPVKEDEAEAGSSKPGIDEGDKAAAAADDAPIDPDELLKASRSCHVTTRCVPYRYDMQASQISPCAGIFQ